MPMKCLTIKPPWSDLIVLGFKRVEFRSWKADYRGPLVIHAGLSVDKSVISHLQRMLDRPWTMNRHVEDEQRERMKQYLAYPRRGVALAVASLVSIDKSEYHDKELGFSPESWGWVLEDIRPLTREVPMKGMLGLFSVSGSIEDQIQRAMAGISKDIKLDLRIQEMNRTPERAVEPPQTVAMPTRQERQRDAQGTVTTDSEGRRYVQRGLFKVPG